MSRIHEILNKAEREGTVRRTATSAEPPEPVQSSAPSVIADSRPPADATPHARAIVSRIRGGAAAPTAAETAGVVVEGAELDALLVAGHAPQSFVAEQFRALRTRLSQVEGGRTTRVIAVTSPAKGDGKSVTAANLALTMGEEFNKRVLLLDADLRRPRVHHLLGLTDGPGLADVLMGMCDIDSVLVHLPDHHLWVLPGGVPPSHPAELLSSGAMRRVIDTLRGRFDRIIVDTPPVSPLADVHILAPLVDGIVVIVRAGMTPKPAIERALSGFDRSKVLGMVLNDAGAEAEAAYDGYGYLTA
jgi:protein-tyrosine kinase